MESLVNNSPGGSSSPSPNGLATATFPTVDPNIIVEYLASVLETTLGASRKDLEKNGSLLSESQLSDTIQRCTRFATESQLVLYIQKHVIAQEEGDVLSEVSEDQSMAY